MLCSVAALGACHKDSGMPAPAATKPRVSAPVPVKQGPSADELTAGMVEAAAPGKSQVPVKLKFDLLQRPTLGQMLEVSIAVMPEIDASPAAIEVTGGEGLTVAPDATQFELPLLEAGQVYRQNLKVTPTAEGVLLLGLTISLKHDETTESRTFSIPLIVGR